MLDPKVGFVDPKGDNRGVSGVIVDGAMEFESHPSITGGQGMLEVRVFNSDRTQVHTIRVEPAVKIWASSDGAMDLAKQWLNKVGIDVVDAPSE